MPPGLPIYLQCRIKCFRRPCYYGLCFPR
uniref:Uncharacterized protein n=1 Tax=Triticum urartu TaxID=4572 RepID=A0A8R7K3Q4_TRIUA